MQTKTEKHMTNLNQIFPLDYPNLPTYEDLLFEVQDLLRHAESPIDILQTINKIQCPYYRKAIVSIIPYHWHQMELYGIEPAVYNDFDGQWRITWSNIDFDMRRIVKQANAEIVEIEQKQRETISPKTHITNHPNHQTTMPLIIQKQEGNITNNQYENCVFYYGTTPQEMPTQQAHTPVAEDIMPVQETPATATSGSLEAFAAMFTFAYSGRRKNDFENMLALIQEPQWENKDRARFALAIYESGNLIPKTRPTSFKKWYQICCNTFGWKQGDYEPRKLTDNEATRQIKIYL